MDICKVAIGNRVDAVVIHDTMSATYGLVLFPGLFNPNECLRFSMSSQFIATYEAVLLSEE